MRDKAPPSVDHSAPTRVMGGPGSTDLEPGTLIAGKYALLHLVGAGGMGKVYAARHVELGLSVAIKIVTFEGGDAESSVRRFLREARAAAALKSIHTVAVHDAGELPSGEPYLVMDLLEGMDLWEYLQERKVLPVAEAVEYVRQAATVLELAHQKGIVHRDIKPTNLFRVQLPDGTGRVKVLDFGLAKRVDPRDASIGEALTLQGDLLGSPAFMSPEQIEGADTVDARTDVWSLTATLYSLLTRSRPFTGKSLAELFTNVMEAEPRDVRELRPDVPAHVALAIARGLEKDRDRRFSTVRELVDALLGRPASDPRLGSGRAVATPAPAPAASAPPAPVVVTPRPPPARPPEAPTRIEGRGAGPLAAPAQPAPPSPTSTLVMPRRPS
ncbi:MAG: serine/threonine protein kinase, partial [Myxococcales bacterium]|nr:serine/threonine protein kinase [Myxococcales bacterium]